ncbi:hypothetical protein [Aquimarina macrocephali]|uniref:hypothetical protein n=1 Tax=Aquimarina macrocephali TaxID=666563 RepID=UPI003F67611B
MNKKVRKNIFNGLILAGLTGIGVTLFNMNGSIHTSIEKSSNLEKRFDNFYDQLPKMHKYLALEEIHKLNEVSLVVSNSYKSSNKYILDVNLIDHNSGKLTDYNIVFSTKKEEKLFSYALKGIVLEYGNSISYKKMQKFSMVAGKSGALPNKINQSCSFILRNEDVTELRDLMKNYDSIPSETLTLIKAAEWFKLRSSILENDKVIFEDQKSKNPDN